MLKERHTETKKISTEIWAIYVTRLNSIDAGVNDKWWDETVSLFNGVTKKYKGTTHEKYVSKYVMACLDDLGEVTQCSS